MIFIWTVKKCNTYRMCILIIYCFVKRVLTCQFSFVETEFNLHKFIFHAQFIYLMCNVLLIFDVFSLLNTYFVTSGFFCYFWNLSNNMKIAFNQYPFQHRFYMKNSLMKNTKVWWFVVCRKISSSCINSWLSAKSGRCSKFRSKKT